MNRIFKTLALFLVVSTVSFVYAQEEFDDADAGKGTTLGADKKPASTTGKVGAKSATASTGNKIGLTGGGTGSGDGPPTADDIRLEARGETESKGAKPSLWERIFGKKATKPAKKPN